MDLLITKNRKTPLFFNRFRENKVAFILFILITLVGWGLRVFQYFMGRSLWEDEAHLALNIMARDFSQLLEPLDHLQMAPILFVLATKSFTEIFGYSELAFRFLPFVFSLVTLPLFYFISLELTKKRATSLIAFLLFAINITPCYFASELKPYGVDLGVCLILIFIAVSKNIKVSKRRPFWLIIAGVISIFLSYTSVVVLTCIVACQVYIWIIKKKINQNYIKVFGIWVVAFLTNYFLFMFRNPNNQGMQDFWGQSFMPVNIFGSDFLEFFQLQYEQVFFRLLLNLPEILGFKYILLFLILVSIISAFIKKNYTLLIFAFLPILINLVLSAMHLYPFFYRLILYLMPAFILIIAYGTIEVLNYIGRKTHLFVYYILTLAFSFFYISKSIQQFPLWHREIGPSITLINEKYSDSNIYITTPINTFTFYDKLGKVNAKNYISLSWNLNPKEFEKKVVAEKKPFVLLVNDYNYKRVIKNLENKQRIKDRHIYKDYGLYVINPILNEITKVDYSSFDLDNSFTLDNEKVVAIWSGAVKTVPVQLNKGVYKMSVLSMGTPVFSEFPHVSIFIDQKKIGGFTTTKTFEDYEFTVEITNNNPILELNMDNDTINTSTGEDRNTFISSILFEKI